MYIHKPSACFGSSRFEIMINSRHIAYKVRCWPYWSRCSLLGWLTQCIENNRLELILFSKQRLGLLMFTALPLPTEEHQCTCQTWGSEFNPIHFQRWLTLWHKFFVGANSPKLSMAPTMPCIYSSRCIWQERSSRNSHSGHLCLKHNSLLWTPYLVDHYARKTPYYGHQTSLPNLSLQFASGLPLSFSPTVATSCRKG
jgi:hypothetical protein